MHAGDTFGGKSHTEMDHNTPVYLIYLVKTRLKKSLHWGVHNHGAQQTNVATCSLYVLYPRTLLSEWRIINTSRTVDKMLLTTWASDSSTRLRIVGTEPSVSTSWVANPTVHWPRFVKESGRKCCWQTRRLFSCWPGISRSTHFCLVLGSFGKQNKLNKFPSQPKKYFMGGEGIVPQTCKATLKWKVRTWSVRARADLIRHMGAWQECLYVDDFPEMWTSESQTLFRVFSALHSHPRLSPGNTLKCMYVIIWHFSMVKHDYQSL